MRALAKRMDSGVRASRPNDRDSGAADLMESRLEFILDGAAVFLTLPATKGSAVVGDEQTEPPHSQTFRLSRYPCRINCAAT